jgi:Subtilase family
MAAPKNRRHIIVDTPPQAEGFTSRRSGRAKPFERPTDRAVHARQLTEGLTAAVEQAAARRVAQGAASEGILVQFEAPPDVDLKLDSLESKRAGIELRAVHRTSPAPNQRPVETATVFIPGRQVKYFLKRFQQYAAENTANGLPKNRELVDRIASVHMATLRALWTDEAIDFPGDDVLAWWEVWLRRDEEVPGAELDRFQAFAAARNVTLGSRRLVFDDRAVCIARATAVQLSASVDVLSDLAELRKAKTGNAFFVDLTPVEQAAWANDLLGRLDPPGADAPAVCVLDTGVTRDHPLIAAGLAPADATAVNAAWGSHDNGGGPGQAGHGTEMAGLALYGDLGPVVQSAGPVVLRHRLESVKILPPAGENQPDLYGAITAEATSRPEIQSPHRRRVFSMAVTAPADGERGQPTSWSAAVDALAAGRSFDANTAGLVYLDQADRDAHRLFVVAAGNVPEAKLQAEHLAVNDLEPVQDPAHAWNVLTVGACTDRALIEDADYDGWTPVANPGDLSPWSATGVTMSSKWPNKPDVVFEGGNVATDGQQFNGGVADLCLLSTFFRPIEKLFVLTNATSTATAQVARLAAIISAEYPLLWPETLRALVVHSAEWTPLMQAGVNQAANRQAVATLLRRYGFGKPAVSRALRSANDALTLISQAVIRPYREGKTREMHVHRLPWPSEVLQTLGDQDVTLRVTLSYFVEPNPARRGWRARHRYASHGLRFDVKTGDESSAEFRRRLNKQAVAADGEQPTTTSDSAKWVLGDQLRHRGSLHSDIWHGSAAELAERGVIGVYPVSGWWKEQPKRDRSALGARYALIVSIETPADDVDIWTPVAQQVGVPVQDIEIDLS